MQMVTFISELKVELVPHMSGSEYFEYHKYDAQNMVTISGEEEVLEVTRPVKRIAVPITRLCRTGKSDVYIAYSEEAEEVLGIPIRTIITEREIASERLNRVERDTKLIIKNRINSLGFLSRIRYMMTGRMEESSWS